VPLDEVLARGGDYLDDEERAELHRELEASIAEAEAGQTDRRRRGPRSNFGRCGEGLSQPARTASREGRDGVMAHEPRRRRSLRTRTGAAKRALEDPPKLGLVYETIRGKVIYRMLLGKRAQHIYYSVDAKAGIVIVHTIWGARRGRGPKP